VASGCGPASGLTCPYHGWRYQLNGALTGVPRSTEIFAGDADGFDKDQFGLLELSIETWAGLIFVNADPAAPGLRETWGALLDYAESNNVATGLVPVARDEQVIDANWKTLVDNVIECYHCAPIHPQLAEVFDVGVKGTALTEFACGSAIELRLRGEHTQAEQDEARYHAYFMPPTTYLSARGSSQFFMTVVDPISAGTSRLITHFMGPENMRAEEITDIVASAELVNQQDSLAATSVQRGYELDPGFEGYQLPHSEQSLRSFARFVLNAVSS
jgi:phenylpropionate dioxygenase-like ring-hydroxylating dioxygenase large terminal subunit